MSPRIANPAELAAGLRGLADDIESGRRPLPGKGRGGRRVHGAPVVPLAVHDALCGWRVATPQGDDGDPLADVLACAGCGMCYLRSEVLAAVADDNPEAKS